jgi:hypothetical protein
VPEASRGPPTAKKWRYTSYNRLHLRKARSTQATRKELSKRRRKVETAQGWVAEGKRRDRWEKKDKEAWKESTRK